MTFNSKQLKAIKQWIDQAYPIKGIYFRSVEYRYMDPKDVLSGRGAQHYGGRFAAVGMRAVYLSTTDSGASLEVTARKTRLGGASQITTDKYPQVVYAVAVNLNRVLDLVDLGSSANGEALKISCLDPADLNTSMDLAHELQANKIQGQIGRAHV